MEAEDENHLRTAKMLREQIKVTTEEIEAMIHELSRLWMKRIDESNERIQVLEAQIAYLESDDRFQVLEARIAYLESGDRFQVLEARIAELEVMISGFNSARSSVYGSTSHQDFRGE